MKIKKTSLILIVLMLFGCGAYFVHSCYTNLQEVKRQQAHLEQRKIAWEALRQILRKDISQFKGEAGIVIKDLGTNWEIFYNKDKLFPSASLAKIPIMSACFLAADEGNIELGQMVALKNRDKLTGSGTLKMARAGSIFSVEELINRMIRDSDNTATNMLTNVIGVDYLRNVFSSFGFKNTNLSRRVADYKSRRKGIENYTTAGDMAMILERMYRRNLVNKKVSEKCLNTMSLKHVNDRISKYLPADVVVAHKTGLERSVCHDVGIVSSDKGDFLICVLTAKNKKSNSARSKRFIARVALHTYEYLYGVRS